MYTRPHHQEIGDILTKFDPVFFRKHNILFGGGTRIALELDEFRESVDIDLFCIGRGAYRAARSEITNMSFGKLLRQGSILPLFANRDIRTDRDAIRALLDGPQRPIKLEIINFSNDRLVQDPQQQLFPIPCVNREGCFATKLTANADRYQNHIKDILDLCMMRREWGEIPCSAWEVACDEYGVNVISSALDEALQGLTARHQTNIQFAVESLRVSESLASELIRIFAPAWRNELIKVRRII